MRPASWTQMATWTRLAASSLTRMCETWALTVATLMKSSLAMSALDLPCPTATATACSRSPRVATAADHPDARARREGGADGGGLEHFADERGRGAGRQDRLAGGDLLNRLDDHRRSRVLEEEAGCAVR